MLASAPNYISRYYIIFFEKFIEKIPNIPSHHLLKWNNFKELIRKVPIPLEEIQRFLSEMYESPNILSIEQLESSLKSTKPSEKPANNVHFKFENNVNILTTQQLHEESPRARLSPLSAKKESATNSPKKGFPGPVIEKKNSSPIKPVPVFNFDQDYSKPKPLHEVPIKNFRSMTHDFQNDPLPNFNNLTLNSKGKLINPFILMQQSPKNPDFLKKPLDLITVITSHKKSEEEENSSPLVGKVTKNEITSHHNESKFKSYNTFPKQKGYILNKHELYEKVEQFKLLFIQHSDTLNTINEKSFEVSTPNNLGITQQSSNDNFSLQIQNPTVINQNAEAHSNLKRYSIFAQHQGDKQQFFLNLDKDLTEFKGNRIIYK